MEYESLLRSSDKLKALSKGFQRAHHFGVPRGSEQALRFSKDRLTSLAVGFAERRGATEKVVPMEARSLCSTLLGDAFGVVQ